MTLGVKPCPQILAALLTDRSNGPEVMPAPTIQLSAASFTHCGTGIVRMWPPFPLRSAMTQWHSRSWRSSNRKFVTSALRRPQPMRSESKARFRRLRRVSAVSAPSSFLPSSAVSQFPTRTPSRRTPFTRRMPAARSGLSSPQSDASYASRRIAANLRLIVDGAYGCCAIRYRVTTVLLTASLGSEQYQSMNSRMAWSYERFELDDVRLFKTADFDCSRSGNLRTVFGTRLLFAI